MIWRGMPWFGAAATLVTAALFAVSLNTGPIGPLALIAPVPLLVYALGAPRWWSALLAALAARALGEATLFIAYPTLPVAALAVMIAAAALLYALVVLLTRWTARRAPAWLAVFTYPAFLASADFLFGLVSPNGSFGAMGYALVDVSPLLQIASVGGMAALSFVGALPAMMLALIVSTPQHWRGALIAGAIPLALTLAFGLWRMQLPFEGQARVALIAIDSTEASAYRDDAQALAVAEAYAREVRALAEAAPDYVVLPEKQFAGGRDASASIALFREAAEAIGAPVLVGFDEILPGGERVNSAALIAPGGGVERYRKRHMIPGLETGYATGQSDFVVGDRGVAICKDFDFPATIRGYGRAGVTLMLAPAWDFVADGRMHARMAVVRGVENGFALARAASAGRLTLSDRTGRVVAESITSRERAASLVGDVGLRSGGTFYTRFGDVFAYLMLALAAALIALRLMRRS